MISDRIYPDGPTCDRCGALLTPKVDTQHEYFCAVCGGDEAPISNAPQAGDVMEKTAKERVLQVYPGAQCTWTSKGWRVFYIAGNGKVIDIGRTRDAHVPEDTAWEATAAELPTAALHESIPDNGAPFIQFGLYCCRHGKDEGSYCQHCEEIIVRPADVSGVEVVEAQPEPDQVPDDWNPENEPIPQEEIGVHLDHCYQGENLYGCKYGNHISCPARPEPERGKATFDAWWDANDPDYNVMHDMCLAAWKAGVASAVREQSGISLIATERARQIAVEGWTPEHDDTHTQAELAKAAEAYVFGAWAQVRHHDFAWLDYEVRARWPWGVNDMPELKPDPIRNLVKAGALIAAEIDRLQRGAKAGRRRGR